MSRLVARAWVRLFTTCSIVGLCALACDLLLDARSLLLVWTTFVFDLSAF